MSLIPQPSVNEIQNRLKAVINGSESRENVSDWAMEYIRNDENVEVCDYKAWHFLVTVSNADAMTEPGKYLYCNEDFADWIKEYSTD